MFLKVMVHISFSMGVGRWISNIMAMWSKMWRLRREILNGETGGADEVKGVTVGVGGEVDMLCQV